MGWIDPDALAPLLADGELREFSWSTTAASVWVACRRRDAEGRALPPVRLTIEQPTVVAVSYDGRTVDTRPSTVRVAPEARVARLDPWPLPSRVEISVNARHEEDDLRVAACADWLQGTPEALPRAPWRVRVRPEARAAWPELDVSVWIAGASIRVSSDGAPLDPERWAEEHAQWWLWADHDAFEPPEAVRGVPLQRGCPDLSHVPPERVPFAPGDTDCPRAVLAPLRAWHQGHLSCDWMSMARAFPHLDRTPPQHASALRAELLGAGFGCWHYIDGVEAWWVEGDRAAVVVCGIDHRVGIDGIEEARGRWSFGLRRHEGRWVIRGRRAVAGL